MINNDHFDYLIVIDAYWFQGSDRLCFLFLRELHGFSRTLVEYWSSTKFWPFGLLFLLSLACFWCCLGFIKSVTNVGNKKTNCQKAVTFYFLNFNRMPTFKKINKMCIWWIVEDLTLEKIKIKKSIQAVDVHLNNVIWNKYCCTHVNFSNSLLYNELSLLYFNWHYYFLFSFTATFFL